VISLTEKIPNCMPCLRYMRLHVLEPAGPAGYSGGRRRARTARLGDEAPLVGAAEKAFSLALSEEGLKNWITRDPGEG